MLSNVLADILENAARLLRNEVCRSISDEQLHNIARSIAHSIIAQTEELSKMQACERLGISRATFDRMVAKGAIPHGHHRRGERHKYWYIDEIVHIPTQSK